MNFDLAHCLQHLLVAGTRALLSFVPPNVVVGPCYGRGEVHTDLTTVKSKSHLRSGYKAKLEPRCRARPQTIS